MGDLTIYTVTHKDFDIAKLNLDECYKVIRVGKYAEQDSDFLSDMAEDDIHDKNLNYCELTALYWIWKNDKDSKYIGLCHYRRYFTNFMVSHNTKGIMKKEDFLGLLSKYDVIVAKKQYSYRGVYKSYLDCGYEKDLVLTEEAISKLYPSYLDSFNKNVKNAVCISPANMYVMSKKMSDKYCEWLFNVLDYVEKHVDISEYNQQEARIFGYLSERLLGVWIDYNKLAVKEVRVINTEEKISAKTIYMDVLSYLGVYQLAKVVAYRLISRRK